MRGLGFLAVIVAVVLAAGCSSGSPDGTGDGDGDGNDAAIFVQGMIGADNVTI